MSEVPLYRKEAWSFCRTSSSVCLCGDLKKPNGPRGLQRRHDLVRVKNLQTFQSLLQHGSFNGKRISLRVTRGQTKQRASAVPPHDVPGGGMPWSGVPNVPMPPGVQGYLTHKKQPSPKILQDDKSSYRTRSAVKLCILLPYGAC